MKKLLWLLLLLPVLAFTISEVEETEKEAVEVNWVSFAEASTQTKTKPKKIFVDVYTDWCHYCKVMDKKTFSDPKVAAYLNEHFYAVKFDAESMTPVQFDNKTFKNQRGTHDLAIAWGVTGYPTGAFLDQNEKPLIKVPGYLDAKTFLLYLQFVAEDHYKSKSFEEFARAN